MVFIRLKINFVEIVPEEKAVFHTGQGIMINIILQLRVLNLQRFF